MARTTDELSVVAQNAFGSPWPEHGASGAYGDKLGLEKLAEKVRDGGHSAENS
jgi:hypothetical protein